MLSCTKGFSFWGTSSPRLPTGALPLDLTGDFCPQAPNYCTPLLTWKLKSWIHPSWYESHFSSDSVYVWTFMCRMWIILPNVIVVWLNPAEIRLLYERSSILYCLRSQVSCSTAAVLHFAFSGPAFPAYCSSSPFSVDPSASGRLNWLNISRSDWSKNDFFVICDVTGIY